MKKLLLILTILFLSANVCFAAQTTSNIKTIVIKNASYVQRAISDGDAQSLKTLIKTDNLNVNDIIYPDLGYDMLAYSLLVKNPNPQVIDLIIKSGANVNAPTKNNGMTPLHLISMREDLQDPVEIVNLLIKAGAEVNHPDALKRYVIVRMVLNGQVECVKALIKAGANVNVKNSQGYSLIKIATVKKVATKNPKYDEIVSVLRKAGSKP